MLSNKYIFSVGNMNNLGISCLCVARVAVRRLNGDLIISYRHDTGFHKGNNSLNYDCIRTVLE